MADLAKDIAFFISGFVAGAGEFGIGLTFFLGDVVKNALNPFVIPQSASVVSTYDTIHSDISFQVQI